MAKKIRQKRDNRSIEKFAHEFRYYYERAIEETAIAELCKIPFVLSKKEAAPLAKTITKAVMKKKARDFAKFRH